jgi:hypothetical protein
MDRHHKKGEINPEDGEPEVMRKIILKKTHQTNFTPGMVGYV